MVNFFNTLFDCIADMFLLLDDIPVVSGVSVLDFLIACVVISTIVPILLTIASAGFSYQRHENIRAQRIAEAEARSDARYYRRRYPWMR